MCTTGQDSNTDHKGVDKNRMTKWVTGVQNWFSKNYLSKNNLLLIVIRTVNMKSTLFNFKCKIQYY